MTNKNNKSIKNTKPNKKDSKSENENTKGRGSGKIHNHLPDSKLINTMQYKINELNEEDELKQKGKKFGPSRKKRLNATKSELMQNIIFPSMANLLYFFETVSSDRRLQKWFQKDIIQLIGMKGYDEKFSDGEFENQKLIYRFSKNNLSRLIKAIGDSFDDTLHTKQDDRTNDALIGLYLYQVQTVLAHKVEKQIAKILAKNNLAAKDMLERFILARDSLPLLIQTTVKDFQYHNIIERNDVFSKSFR